MKEPRGFAHNISQIHRSGWRRRPIFRIRGNRAAVLLGTRSHTPSHRSVISRGGVYVGAAPRSERALDLPSKRAVGAVLPPLLRRGHQWEYDGADPNRLDGQPPVLRHGRCSGRDRLGRPARTDACNEDDERGRERHAVLVVGEAARAFNNGDRCTMDTEDRPDEADRLHSEWPIVHGDSAIDLVHRGEPGDDTRGRCGCAGTASETSDAGRLLCTAARNLRHLHLSLGRSVERRSKRLRRAVAWATQVARPYRNPAKIVAWICACPLG